MMKVIVDSITILNYVHIQHIQHILRTTIFNENLVAVHRNKKYITLHEPIVNGMIILEPSKSLMYIFVIMY